MAHIYPPQDGGWVSTMTTATNRQRPQTADRAPEPIRPGEMLTLSEFLRRTRQGRHAWTQAKIQAAELGIRLAYEHGRQVYVSTDSWIAYLMARPERRSRTADASATDEAEAISL
jgi:hypothetical protein